MIRVFRALGWLSRFSCSKVVTKNSKYFGNFWKKLGIFLNNFRKFDHNFETRNARKLMKCSKDSYYSLESHKILRHKIGSFGQLPGDDDVTGIKTGFAQTYIYHVNINKEPDNQNWNKFLLQTARRSPSSALASSAGDSLQYVIWIWSTRGQRLWEQHVYQFLFFGPKCWLQIC